MGDNHRWDGVTLMQRWARKVRLPSEWRDEACWEWTGALNGFGYGYLWRDWAAGKQVLAHRYSYERFVGEMPAGLVTDHLCRNRRCVNPTHLEAVSIAENTRRGVKWVRPFKEFCVHGHAYTEQNTVRLKVGKVCRECRRLRDRLRGWRRPSKPAPM